MSVKRISIVLLALVIVSGFITLGVKDAVKTKDSLDFQKVELKSKQSDIQELNIQYDKLNTQLNKASQDTNTSKDQVKKLQDEKQQLEDQKKQLENQLQARIETKNKLALAAQSVVAKATATSVASAASVDGGGVDCGNQSSAKAFIYCNESGNTPDKWNGSGCFGLGQDCNGIVFNQCGVSYSCQDEYFTGYMSRRYGSWEAAKAHWLARVPINGRDVGNWW